MTAVIGSTRDRDTFSHAGNSINQSDPRWRAAAAAAGLEGPPSKGWRNMAGEPHRLLVSSMHFAMNSFMHFAMNFVMHYAMIFVRHFAMHLAW